MTVGVAIESGSKRVFAVAVDWPGLARAAKTEDEALQTLLGYGERYRASVGTAANTLKPPRDVGDLEVVERTGGGSGTDFGVPSGIARFDRKKLSPSELDRRIDLLRGAWAAFDTAARRASGRELAKGPRGGGRSMSKIVDHVREADRAYIGQIGAKAPPPGADRAAVQTAFIDALLARVRGELPEHGPRGGERWPAAYAIRRSAWHSLDHAWEIEDRSGLVKT